MDAAEKLTRQVTDALDRLPKTAEGIADYFTQAQIKGRPLHIDSCPIARYVAAECDTSALRDHEPVGVCQKFVALYPALPSDLPSVLRIDGLPSHVAEFVTAFDGRRWPNLIERPAS